MGIIKDFFIWSHVKDGRLTRENLKDFEDLSYEQQKSTLRHLQRTEAWPEGDISALALITSATDPLFIALASDNHRALDALITVISSPDDEAETNKIIKSCFLIACEQNALVCANHLIERIPLSESFALFAEGGLHAAKRGHAYMVDHLAGSNQTFYASPIRGRDPLASFLREVRTDVNRPPKFYQAALNALLKKGASPQFTYQEPENLNHLGWCALEDAAKIRMQQQDGYMDMWNAVAARDERAAAWYRSWVFSPTGLQFKNFVKGKQDNRSQPASTHILTLPP